MTILADVIVPIVALMGSVVRQLPLVTEKLLTVLYLTICGHLSFDLDLMSVIFCVLCLGISLSQNIYLKRVRAVRRSLHQSSPNM